MKNQWYADNKDIPKWSALARLLPEQRTACLVLYVPMLRPSPPLPHLLKNGASCGAVDPLVATHFRDVGSLRSLAANLRVTWTAVESPFSESDRTGYFRRVCEVMTDHRGHGSVVVLVDPDNGIAPRTPGDDPEAYVNADDLHVVFSSLRQGDRLAVYQHVFRGGDDARLVQHARARLSDALNAWPNLTIDDYRMPDLTREAVVLAVEKP